MTDKSPEDAMEEMDDVSAFGDALTRLLFPEHKSLPLNNNSASANLPAWILQQPSSSEFSGKSLLAKLAGGGNSISRDIANRLYFADKVLDAWLQQLSLDSEICEVLTTWRPGLTAILTAEPDRIVEPEHPIRQLLAAVEQHSWGWFAALERAGKPWLEHLQSIGQFLSSQECLQVELQMQQLLKTQDFIGKDLNRVRILEKRVREAEIGADRAWYLRQIVHKHLNDILNDQSIPEVITQFIVGPWRDSMQLQLMEEGLEGRVWQRQRKIAETLVWSMQDQDEPQAKQKLYQVGAQLPNELEKGLLCFKHNPHEAAPWLDRVQELLMMRVKGQTLPAQPTTLLPMEPNFRLKTDVGTDQGHGLLDKWYLQTLSGSRQKCLAYLPYQESVVWVNYLGKKLGTQHWSSVKEELKSQALDALTGHQGFNDILQETVSRFLSVVTLQDKQRRLANEREAARIKAEELAREQARLKAAAEAKRIALAREEALRKHEEERRIAEEQAHQEKLAAEERARVAHLQSLRESVDRMRLGAWLELKDGDEQKRCKLAVRINATEKLVFVDRLGLRVAELKRDELIERLLVGSARILDEGTDFDQRLSRVVGSIRADKR